MFSKARNPEFTDPTRESLFDLPQDIIQYKLPAAAHTNGYYSTAATGVMATLSQTCRTMYMLFKPELNNKRELISYILYPNEVNAKKVVEIAQNYPGLFFIPVQEIIDHAKTLDGVHRIYENWCAYLLLFLGDVELLKRVKPHLNVYLDRDNKVGNVTHSHEFAHQLVLAKFPNGFDFPPCTDQFKRVLTAFETAITHDQQLIQTGKPSHGTAELGKLLEQQCFNRRVETGHPFNMNDVIELYKIYDQNYNPWNEKQLIFFSTSGINVQLRFMTAAYFLRTLQGLQNLDQPLKRCYEVTSYAYSSAKKVRVVPFDADPKCRLGKEFLIESCYGVVGVEWLSVAGMGALFTQLCQANTSTLSKLMRSRDLPVQSPSPSPCVIS